MGNTKIEDLKFDDKNFNKHTEYGMSLLEKSLRENGAGRSILIDKDNNIIAGNGIIEAAGSVGLEKVKIVETDGTEIIAVKRTDVRLDSKQGRKMALADNATASADLEWDEENLKSEFDEEELKDWGVDVEWQDETEVEEDEAPEVNENEPADSELGKVYKLGNHRLMCGDSTDAGSVAILMDGQKADMVFTDPPYNVAYEGGSKKREKIKNDDIRDFRNFLELVYRNCYENMKDGASIYVCHSELERMNFTGAFEESGFKLSSVIIWVKNNSTFSMNKDYKQKHEPILFGWKGAGHKWYGGNCEVTVWEIARPVKSELHPTMKPIELCVRAIKNSSKGAELVYEPFGGSGSTLIACEQLGRKCYMMELDPHYCDVIRKRYWKFTTGSEEGWQDGTKAI